MLFSLEARVAIGPYVREAVKQDGCNIEEWVKQAINLGLLVEEGNVYQNIGGTYIPLKMHDITPLKQIVNPFDKNQYKISIPTELKKEIKKVVQTDFGTWMSKALFLRLNAPNMELSVLQNGEYTPVTFKKELQSA